MIFKRNVRLAPLSTFRIGGRAEFFYLARSPEKLIEAIDWIKKKKMPFKVFAGGSNVVFPDKKLRGVLVQVKGGLIRTNGSAMLVDAGVSLAQVIKKSIRLGLGGLETLSGIPGTVGGAIVGNAGAYGHSISEAVERVLVWDGKKKRWLKNKDCQFAYRESVFKHKPYLVLQAVLRFKKSSAAKLERISRHIIKIREKKYKPGLRCPGSFFKNVLVKDVSGSALGKIDKSKIIDGKIPAGYLLEKVGARGMRVGGIEIAKFHGNLFVNRGGAKASDVKKLARILKNKVKKKFGIELEEEIRYL